MNTLTTDYKGKINNNDKQETNGKRLGHKSGHSSLAVYNNSQTNSLIWSPSVGWKPKQKQKPRTNEESTKDGMLNDHRSNAINTNSWNGNPVGTGTHRMLHEERSTSSRNQADE